MKDHPANKINNAFLDIRLDRMNETGLSSDWAVEWSKEYIFDLIDRYADELTGEDSVILIPELTISLNITVGHHLMEENSRLRTEIGEQIKNALKRSILKHQATGISLSVYKTRIIMGFISSGQLPRSYDGNSWKEMIAVFSDMIVSDKSMMNQLFGLAKDRESFARLMTLIDQETLDEMLVRWSGEKRLVRWIAAINRLIENNQEYFKKIPAAEIYQRVLPGTKDNSRAVKNNLKRILGDVLIPPALEPGKLKIPGDLPRDIVNGLIAAREIHELVDQVNTGEKKDEKLPEVLEDGAHVGQAGLVLLAPFLPAFLRNTGMLDSEGNLRHQKKIPVLLNYMATGEKEVPEWELTLPKILAGLRPGDFCDTKIDPDARLDRQIKALMRSVITNWKELKKTSPEGLRNTFMIRQGKLHMKNGFYYLYVREQTVDILLAYVPWNYKTIKFDWMKHILFVEWNKES